MHTLTLKDIARLLNCKGNFASIPVAGYCTDSRSIQPGELFFALNGARVDGHSYLKQVKEQRAVAAVVSTSYSGEIDDLPLIVVKDPLSALQTLAQSVLKSFSPRVVAITGSLGKTSTKEFTKTLLQTQYQVSASPGNSNSQVGLPLAILNHTSGNEEICIFEMGMTQPGHISQLIGIAPPEVALITTTALVHACGFESLEEIGRAKGEIFSHPATKLGILHRDIINFDEIWKIGSCDKISFSTISPADYSILPEHQLFITRENTIIPLGNLPVLGAHNVHNLLAAIAVARYFNVDLGNIQRAVPLLSLPDRRLQLVKHQGILFLNDSYNAAEASVKSALTSLPKPEKLGKKIAVLGSMLELGKFSHDCHQRVGEFALDQVECMYCLGEECLPIYDVWSKEGRPVQLFHSRRELVASLRKNLKNDDVVLLKGSRSKELWKILEEL